MNSPAFVQKQASLLAIHFVPSLCSNKNLTNARYSWADQQGTFIAGCCRTDSGKKRFFCGKTIPATFHRIGVPKSVSLCLCWLKLVRLFRVLFDFEAIL